MRKEKTVLFAGVLIVAAGCGGGGGGDGGSDGGDCQFFDDTVTDAIEAWTDIPEEGGTVTAVDLASCTPDNSTTDACPFNGQVIDFQEDEWLPSGVLGGTTVVIFVDNRIDDPSVLADIAANCAAADDDTAVDPTCYWAAANTAGQVSFPYIHCETRFAIWAHKFSTIAPPTKPAVEFNRISKTGDGIQTVLTISQSTYELVPGIVGFTPDPTLGIVAGKVADCADNGVANVSTHIIDGHTSEAPEDFCGDAVINRVGTFYFRDNFPADDQTVTSEDGLWAFANVPPGNITIFGFDNEGGTRHLIGHVELVSLPDTITIADLLLDTP